MSAISRGPLALLGLSATAVGLLAGPSLAADQAVRGAAFVVTDPKPAEPARRKLSFTAKDAGGGHTPGV